MVEELVGYMTFPEEMQHIPLAVVVAQVVYLIVLLIMVQMVVPAS